MNIKFLRNQFDTNNLENSSSVDRLTGHLLTLDEAKNMDETEFCC